MLAASIPWGIDDLQNVWMKMVADQLYAIKFGRVLILTREAAELLDKPYTAMATNSLGDWARHNARVWIELTSELIGLAMTANRRNHHPLGYRNMVCTGDAETH